VGGVHQLIQEGLRAYRVTQGSPCFSLLLSATMGLQDIMPVPTRTVSGGKGSVSVTRWPRSPCLEVWVLLRGRELGISTLNVVHSKTAQHRFEAVVTQCVCLTPCYVCTWRKSYLWKALQI
jgi:hypothetical protein